MPAKRASPRRPAKLWQISLQVSHQAEEPAAALLEQVLGTPPAIYTDVESEESTVSVYGPQSLTPRQRRQLRDGLDALVRWNIPVGPAQIRSRRVRLRQWAHAWKHHFRPLHIGSRLIIRPSWRKISRRPGQVVITLDPGLAFGTGHHPTTAFCLGQIVQLARRKQSPSLLDVGTGSGILAIAAAKLGYGPVVATDCSIESVEVAQANARRNRADGRIQFVCQDIGKRRPPGPTFFDVVCANLVSDLLCQQRARLGKLVAPGGCLVLAGILSSQFREVESAFASLGFARTQDHLSGEWRSGSFQR